MWKVILSIGCCFSFLIACSSSEKREKAQLHLQIGLSHYENSNYPMALKEFLIAKDLDPKSPLVHNNLGLAYFVRDRIDLAEKHLRIALDLKSNYTDARNNLSRILIEKGNYVEAQKELKLVLADLTYTAADKALVNMGLSYFNQMDYSMAANYFSQSVRQNRENCVANSYLGRCYFELKDYARASQILDQAIGYCQKSSFDEPHYYSALSYYRQGNSSKAISRFQEILKIYPHSEYRDKSRAMLDIIKKDTP